jgi:circadian clock protein KaiB
MPPSKRTIAKDLSAAPLLADEEVYILRLYVAGVSAQSSRAIAAVRQFCEEYLPGRSDLEVIDIYQLPALAREEQIIAVPTLVRHSPKPLRRLVGDLSNSERVLTGLDLAAGAQQHAPGAKAARR